MVQGSRLTWQFAVLVAAAVVLGGAEAKPPSKVVNGDDAAPGEFPYQVSLRMYGQHVCGGTIIGKRHILTAGHCFDSPYNAGQGMTVVTGTNELRSGMGKVHKIRTVTIHPYFINKAEASWQYDVAVITLSSDIKFDAVTQSARLPSSDVSPNAMCIASGWGDTYYPNGPQPNHMKKAEMMTISNDVCQMYHEGVQILHSHLCAHSYPGTGLCTGDSGGGLVYNGEVVGIASFVIPCARGVPDVFTRVYSYIDFIKGVIARS